MWTSLLKTVLGIAEKVIDRANFKMLTERSDNIAKLETQLNAEYAKPLDLQDDLLIPYLEDRLEVEVKAFERQLAVAGQANINMGASS